MAFESWRSKFNMGEVRYLKATVGHALNECITELIQVRPTDPVEYMAFWMRRYVDTRKYFARKQAFYQGLMEAKTIADEKMLVKKQTFYETVEVLQNVLNEAESQTIAENSPEAEIEAGSNLSRSMPLLTHSDTYVSEKEKLENEADDSGEEITVKTKHTSSARSLGERSHSNKGTVKNHTKNSRDKKKEIALNRTENSSNSGSSTSEGFTKTKHSTPTLISARHSAHTNENIHKGKSVKAHKRKNIPVLDRKTSDSGDELSPVVMHRTGSLEVNVGEWKMRKSVVYCQHPILGMLSTQGPPPRTSIHEEAWMRVGFADESFYDHELYLVTSGFETDDRDRGTDLGMTVDLLMAETSKEDMATEQNMAFIQNYQYFIQ